MHKTAFFIKSYEKKLKFNIEYHQEKNESIN